MSYPVGNQIRCSFELLLRDLTPLEAAAFEKGDGLPDSVAIDPPPDKVFLDYWTPAAIPANGWDDESPPDPTGTFRFDVDDQVVLDEPGAYHVVLVGDVRGEWHHRGRGVTSLDVAMVASPIRSFVVR